MPADGTEAVTLKQLHEYGGTLGEGLPLKQLEITDIEESSGELFAFVKGAHSFLYIVFTAVTSSMGNIFGSLVTYVRDEETSTTTTGVKCYQSNDTSSLNLDCDVIVQVYNEGESRSIQIDVMTEDGESLDESANFTSFSVFGYEPSWMNKQ